MVWWKKESNEKLPELPELPELPPLTGKTIGREISSSRIIPEAPMRKADLPEIPSIPSLPSSQTGNKLSYDIVKRAVKDDDNEEIEMPKLPEEISKKTKEIDYFEIPKIEKSHDDWDSRIIQSREKTEPIYVRIDKYQESLSSFNEVKKRLLEIENLLRDIKEIRAKEEGELQGWIAEIQEAKSKLNEVDKTVFQKLEE